MSTLTVELSPELLERLQAEANRRQEPPERTAVTLLEERLAPPAEPEESEREKVRRVLREAGLLSELSPTLRAHAEKLAGQLGSEEEMENRRRELQSRQLDPPLSQDILDMRGPKS